MSNLRKNKKDLKVWKKEQDDKGINWRKKKTRTCRTCKLNYSTIITSKKHRESFCAKNPESIDSVIKQKKLIKSIKNSHLSPFPKVELNLFDKEHIRLPTKNKKPLINNWTNFEYRENQEIRQLLEKNGEYGLRTGKILFEDYYFCVIIFQKKGNDNDWFEWISLEELDFLSQTSYVETEKTYHYYLLIKDLPPNCSLIKKGGKKSLGCIFSNGKQVIGIKSNLNGFIYQLKQKEQGFFICETFKDLENLLNQKDIYFNFSSQQPSETKLKEELNEKAVFLFGKKCVGCNLLIKTKKRWERHLQRCRFLKLKNFSVENSNKINVYKENWEPNEEQKSVKDLVLQGKNIFLTGSAGTGKSSLLRHLITVLQEKYGKDRVGITSTTGTGAIIINGSTLHSYLGIGTTEGLENLLKRISLSRLAVNNWKRTKVLIIDEISMLPGELFENLEQLAREIRRNEKPFGGIQIILVGDFCQLPPVSKRIPKYCFEVPTWYSCIDESINLVRTYRQKSNWFINYLQDIRFGQLSKQKWENMIKWLGREPNWPNDNIKPIWLFSTNEEVGNINEQELDKLPGKIYSFFAKDEEKEEGKLKEWIKSCSAPEKLELKIGAQVMFIKNWREEGLVNGSQGVVVSFTNGNSPSPIVKFINGKKFKIEKWKWEKIEGYNEKNQPIISASRTQIPLILSWAITINKSQGQSLDRLKVDLKKCFVGGQVYTALSRATNTNFLQIMNLSYSRIWCDEKVKAFYFSLINKNKKVKKYPF